MAEQVITLTVKNQGLQASEQLLSEIVTLLKKQQIEQKKTADQTRKSTQSAIKAFGDFRQALDQTLNIIKNIGVIASKVFGPIIEVFKEQTKIAGKFVDNIAQMEAALNNIPTDKTAEDFVKYADKLALATGQSQDFLFEISKLSVQLTNSADNAEDMTKAAVAISKAVGVDAKMAVRGLAQTLEGQTGTLARYLPALRDLTEEQLRAGEAINLINERFGPALEARLNTTVGQYERLSNIIGDRYLEVLGLAVVQNDAFTAAMRDLGDQLVKLAPSVDDLIPIVQRVIEMGLSLVLGLTNAVQGFADVIQSIAGPLGLFADIIFDLLILPLKNLMRVITTIISALDLLGAAPKGLVGFAESTKEFFEDLEGAGSKAVEKFANGMEVVGKAARTTEALISQALVTISKFDHTAAKSNKKQKKIFNNRKKLSKEEEKRLKKLNKIRMKYAKDAIKITEKMWADQIKEQEWAQKRQIELTEKFLEDQVKQREAAAARREIILSAVPGGEVVAKTGDIMAGLTSADPKKRKEALAKLAASAISGLAEGVAKAIDLIRLGFGKLKDVFDFFLKNVLNPKAFEKQVVEIQEKLQKLSDPENFEQFLNSFDKAFEMIVDFLSDEDKIRMLAEQFINFFTEAIQTFADNIGPILEVIVPALVDLIVQAFQALVENLDTILEAIVPAIIEMIKGIVTAIAESDFLMTLVDSVVKLVLGILEVIIENLPQILSNIVKAVLNGIADFIEGIIEMLAKPDFISNFVVGIVNLIFDIIEGLAKMAGKIVTSILKNLLPIVFEVFKAVVKAIAQIFLRGMWAVLRIIVRIVTFGTTDIGSAPGTKRAEADAAKATALGGGGDEARFHNGGIFKYAHNGNSLAPGERIIAQDGEAMVIPIGPKKFGGMSTDGKGNIKGNGGGRPINVTINAVDAQSFRQMMQRNGLEVLIDLVDQNVPDGRNRLLKRALSS